MREQTRMTLSHTQQQQQQLQKWNECDIPINKIMKNEQNKMK